MFGDKLKKVINKNEENQEGNNKKRVENLVFFIILAIITVVVINILWNGNKTTTKQEIEVGNKKLANANTDTIAELNTELENNSLELRLEKILSNIQGVGEVKVFINYSESSKVVAMYNETSKTSNTEESDKSGGARKIESKDIQKDIIYKEEDGEKTPITQKIVQPKVEGAIITAKGANNITIKTNIIQAVEAVTGLATHKIQVFEMN